MYCLIFDIKRGKTIFYISKNAGMDFTTVHVGHIVDNVLTVKSVTKSTGRVRVAAILIFYHPCVKVT